MFRIICLSIAFAGWFAVTASAAEVTIISVPNSIETQVYGLNNHGDVAGFYKDSAGKQHGFTLSKGVYTYPIDVPVTGATYTQIWGINEAGDLVGNYSAPGGNPPLAIQHGFLLGRKGFSSFDVPNSTFTAGFGVNTEGDVTGHYGTPPSGKMRGFLMRNGGFSTFGAEDWGRPNTMTCGFGLNAEQTVVGHFADGTGTHGFMLAGSVFTPINVPETGATNTNAYGINPEGEIVGYYKNAAGKIRGFHRSGSGEFLTFDASSDALATYALPINARGQIAGYFKGSENVWRGFIISR